MTMTPASKEYFDQNAEKWDGLQASYYTETLRTTAIRKAYLRPEYIVADIGAGTGFMTAGLAPLVQQVYALDGSMAMLDIARKNLGAFTNVIYDEADGLKLPAARRKHGCSLCEYVFASLSGSNGCNPGNEPAAPPRGAFSDHRYVRSSVRLVARRNGGYLAGVRT